MWLLKASVCCAWHSEILTHNIHLIRLSSKANLFYLKKDPIHDYGVQLELPYVMVPRENSYRWNGTVKYYLLGFI